MKCVYLEGVYASGQDHERYPDDFFFFFLPMAVLHLQIQSFDI